MTIVVSKKFSDRICVLSDTMISDKGAIKNNIIPGRLKSIVINSWLTVSYAGVSIQAIDAVRELYRTNNLSTELAIKHLAHVSKYYNGEIDFILCSHEHDPRMVKIANGQSFEGGDAYWIGSSQAAIELSKTKFADIKDNNLPDYISAEEMLFKREFDEFMRSNRCEGIGGAIIDCLCSPYGHCYISHASSFSWDRIPIGKGKDDSNKRAAVHKTGMYSYEYNVCSTSSRGVAIVGFYLGQAEIGYIYDPIHSDDAKEINNLSMQDFSRIVEHAGKVLAM